MKLFDSISDKIGDWAMRQPVFFTGSASLHGRHINVSPKGLADSHFAILDPNTCAYIDRTGSGCETIAHAYENGRLCLMFMSFGNMPRILRFFCRAMVIEANHPDYGMWLKRVAQGKRENFEGARAVVVGHVWQVQTSCGYGVPRVKMGLYRQDEDEEPIPVQKLLMQGAAVDRRLDELCVFEERPTMDKDHQSQSEEQLALYRARNNARSMDGLPGLRTARTASGEWLWVGNAVASIKILYAERISVAIGFILAVFMYVVLELLDILPRIR